MRPNQELIEKTGNIITFNIKVFHEPDDVIYKTTSVKPNKIKTENHNGNLSHALRVVDYFFDKGIFKFKSPMSFEMKGFIALQDLQCEPD